MSEACENIYKERDIWRFRLGIRRAKFKDALPWKPALITIWYQSPRGTFRRLL